MKRISTTGRSPAAAAPTAVPDDGGLGDGGVQHPLRPNSLKTGAGHAEAAAELAHVLAVDVDVRVAAHLEHEGVGDGLL